MNLMTLDFASAQDSHDGCDDASHNHAAHDNTAHHHAPAAKPAVPEEVQEAIRTLLRFAGDLRSLDRTMKCTPFRPDTGDSRRA